MSFPSNERSEKFQEDKAKGEYMKAKADYLACKGKMGSDAFMWYLVCDDKKVQQYSVEDIVKLENQYKICYPNKRVDVQGLSMGGNVSFDQKKNIGYAGECTVYRVCKSRGEQWVYLEHLNRKVANYEFKNIIEKLNLHKDKILNNFIKELESIKSIQILGINFNNNHNSLHDNTFKYYKGSEFNAINRLYYGKKYKNYKIYNSSRFNCVSYIRSRFLRYMIQLCKCEFPITVYRGIPKIAKITKEQLQFSSNLDNLITKLRLYFKEDKDIANVVDNLYLYNSAPEIAKLDLNKRVKINNKTGHLNDILELLTDKSNIDKVMELVPLVVAVKAKNLSDSLFIPQENTMRNIGDTVVFSSFTSTTLDKNVAINFAESDAGHILKIEIPKGFPCWSMASGTGGEEEILLPPCCTFVITGFENNNKNIVLLKPIGYKSIEMDDKTFERDAHSYVKYVHGITAPSEEDEKYYKQLYEKEICHEISVRE